MTMKTPPPSTAPTPPSALALRTSPIAGITLAVFLGAGLLSCGWLAASGKLELMPEKHLSNGDVLHGEITHRIAKELAKAPLPGQAADLERAGSWLVLGDTGPRVRPGCAQWLFLADELKVNRHAADNAKAKADAVIALQQGLQQRGIRLLVSVVPDKSRIAASELCGLTRPGLSNARIQQWAQLLKGAGVTTLDLTASLQPLGAEAFLRTDTHWSETGAQAAAQAIAEQVKRMGLSATPNKAFDTHQEALAPRPGDLVRLAGIDWLPVALQPPQEQVAPTVITERVEAASGSADNLDDLFGDDNLPNVALIGTSFSRNSNFVGFLQRALAAPIGNFAKDGGEFSGAAKAYFDSPAFKQTPPQLVIWEIPERDLQTPYAGDVHLD
ncbi:alginate O-acetyltransferase AlgX-related protein [Pseudomonas aegrilactucae]|uniref:Cell division protein FtsQ n=1 Tax=Pseudomonas aegrilactucae TaxID=2854028 RepID=A0A9Q2XML0_9PSED|nr:cell division protein FtsQ [Pseudomonas aegrilactucae]MBV6288881.1 cell division protein FtsQ [Pseudomonas aegrilactucae]